MHHRHWIAAIALTAAPLIGLAQQHVRLDGGVMVSDEETTLERLRCGNTTVQFARGLRWTAPDYSPQISINDRTTFELPPSCYLSMACASYRGKPAVVIVDAPACGGNAVEESHIVIELPGGKRHTLSAAQARKAGLIR